MDGIEVKKGQEMGMFKMGSTIVMIAEVHKDAKILI